MTAQTGVKGRGGEEGRVGHVGKLWMHQLHLQYMCVHTYQIDSVV